jgi:hypothetical protein
MLSTKFCDPYAVRNRASKIGDFSFEWGREFGDFSLLQNVQTGSWGPPSFLFSGYRVYFPGVKAAGV